MKNDLMGYRVEYSTKERFFDSFGDMKKALVTQDGLIKMLQNKSAYLIWNAHLTNLEEYRTNHEPDSYENLTKNF